LVGGRDARRIEIGADEAPALARTLDLGDDGGLACGNLRAQRLLEAPRRRGLAREPLDLGARHLPLRLVDLAALGIEDLREARGHCFANPRVKLTSWSRFARAAPPASAPR